MIRPQDEDLIALYARAPDQVGRVGLLRLQHLREHSLGARLLAAFYHDFHEELRTTEGEGSPALLTYVEELLGD